MLPTFSVAVYAETAFIGKYDAYLDAKSRRRYKGPFFPVAPAETQPTVLAPTPCNVPFYGA